MKKTSLRGRGKGAGRGGGRGGGGGGKSGARDGKGDTTNGQYFVFMDAPKRLQYIFGKKEVAVALAKALQGPKHQNPVSCGSWKAAVDALRTMGVDTNVYHVINPVIELDPRALRFAILLENGEASETKYEDASQYFHRNVPRVHPRHRGVPMQHASGPGHYPPARPRLRDEDAPYGRRIVKPEGRLPAFPRGY